MAAQDLRVASTLEIAESDGRIVASRSNQAMTRDRTYTVAVDFRSKVKFACLLPIVGVPCLHIVVVGRCGKETVVERVPVNRTYAIFMQLPSISSIMSIRQSRRTYCATV